MFHCVGGELDPITDWEDDTCTIAEIDTLS